MSIATGLYVNENGTGARAAFENPAVAEYDRNVRLFPENTII
jgi:hypothetical protein